MVIIGLADIHSDTEHLGALSDPLTKADVVLVAGDITTFGHREEAFCVINELRKYSQTVLTVAGNCDHREVDDYLSSEGINLHLNPIGLGGVTFVGIGGSLPCPSPTPNERAESSFEALLNDLSSRLVPDEPTILVTHQPPFGASVDVGRVGNHVGSRSIRQFIAQHQPLICFTGHMHKARGIDAIGDTRIVNPGRLREGHYAYAEVDHRVQVLEIRGP